MSSNEAQQVSQSEQRKHPCVLCQQRKVRCDRSEPCKNCLKAGVECVSAATLPPRKRKRRFPEAELLARLKRYERHLIAYGADLNAINSENGGDGSLISSTPVAKSNHSNSPVQPRSISPDPALRTLSVRRSLRHFDNLNLGVSEEFRDTEDLLQGSSDDEMYSKPLSKTYEELGGDIGGDGEDLFFGSNTGTDLKDLHPAPVHIFRLWQTFLDNVNPLIKIFHAPTVQQQILDATGNLDSIPKNTQALIFCIYATAIMSMSEIENQKIFNEKKDKVLTKFQSRARQALRIAGYLRSSDLVVLQALTLYLFSSLQMTIDPRSLFCLTGVAVRIAQRMGLSTDGSHYALPPFEVEMRRRLWWQIVLIDTRISELSGAGASILTYTWNTKLPSNINDSDLFPGMKDAPVQRPGITEMIFVRVRCETRKFVEESRKDSHAVIETQPNKIDDFEQLLQRDYLSHCDQSIPLHVMSTLTVKLFLCKLRMGFRHPSFLSAKNNEAPDSERDFVFKLSLTMLEYHNAAMRNTSIQNFLWHIYTNFPFPAHIYLLCALRIHTTGEFAEKAWAELAESGEARLTNDDFRTYNKKKLSFIHLAMGRMTLKAWNAREAAFQNSPQALPVPRFVTVYKNQLEGMKSGKEPRWWDGTTDSSPISLDDHQPLEDQVAARFPMFHNGPGMGQFTNPTSPVGTMPWPIESQLLQHPSFPGHLPPGWDFWNNMMRGGDSMQGIDAIPPPYNYQP